VLLLFDYDPRGNHFAQSLARLAHALKEKMLPALPLILPMTFAAASKKSDFSWMDDHRTSLVHASPLDGVVFIPSVVPAI